jgi:hypothetical protein
VTVNQEHSGKIIIQNLFQTDPNNDKVILNSLFFILDDDKHKSSETNYDHYPDKTNE